MTAGSGFLLISLLMFVDLTSVDNLEHKTRYRITGILSIYSEVFLGRTSLSPLKFVCS